MAMRGEGRSIIDAPSLPLGLGTMTMRGSMVVEGLHGRHFRLYRQKSHQRISLVFKQNHMHKPGLALQTLTQKVAQLIRRS